jgi:hypothetical protein
MHINVRGIAASLAFLTLSLLALPSPADPPSKSAPPHSSTSGILDQYVPDEPADPTTNLQRMHDNIESQLSEADRKSFESYEAGIHNSAARKSYYLKVCAQFHIDPC